MSVTQYAKENNLPIFTAGEIEYSKFVYPCVYNQFGYKPSDLKTKIASSNLPYVAELYNAVIYSRSSIIIAGNSALSDTLTHPSYGAYVDLSQDVTLIRRDSESIYMQHADYRIEEHDGGIFLGGLASNEFGHWPNEFLPKLEFFEQHLDFNKLPIIVDEKMPQSHFDYLNYMTNNQVLRLPANTGWRCRCLLVASTPAFIPTDVVKDHPIPIHELAPLPPAKFRFLRDRVNGKIKGKSRYGSKLYLSRRNMRTRRLINEIEIEEYLLSQGFDIVHVENLSFVEQVCMFRDATYIVAPYGSSLLNLIYASTDIKLLILSQQKLHGSEGFYGQMRELGYQMLFVTGDIGYKFKHADYSVPVERIRDALIFYDELVGNCKKN